MIQRVANGPTLVGESAVAGATACGFKLHSMHVSGADDGGLPPAALSLSPGCGRLRRHAPGARKGRIARNQNSGVTRAEADLDSRSGSVQHEFRLP
jgi:hypothetical protein